MKETIGILEFSNVIEGISCIDNLLKNSIVNIVLCKIIMPSKYLIIFSGTLGNVENAIEIAIDKYNDGLIDFSLQGTIDSSIIEFLNDNIKRELKGSLAIFQFDSVCKGISYSNKFVKNYPVEIINIDFSDKLNGNSVVYLCGDLSALKQITNGLNAKATVIANPHELTKDLIFRHLKNK